MRIALAQVAASDRPGDNADLVADYTARAAQAGARLVVFPEATMCRFGVPLAPVAEPLDGPWADRVAQSAHEHGVTVAAGMFTPSGDRVANTLLVAGPDGRTGYSKVHLFDAFGFVESRTVAPGDEAVTVEVDGVRVGLTICYDIRFPALFTALADAGADVIAVAASWGAGPGKLDAWTTLARARALDTTTYVVACDQADPGEPDPRGAPRGVGGSLAVGPDGEILTQAGPGPDLLVVDIDTDRVAAVRETLPVLANRRDFRHPHRSVRP
ncbi:carbon-nitrogen hydrolase family protein [Tsukamurella sp. 8F]|uniref:carbon-nitrogen hydrolase family protein n=1 Tax=unclassified Tsukamurella TaxID=2633480 RepID=UPI0023B9874F|nr:MULTISPECIES: carbon-nitrogen hydrolase family protein [unclassified Tsukamurella]MDF0528317.1 carbon-nitrogen hydrolase family protein [Tsukamurella sp. 8J]MDF0586142.1 carbon-nitrogen hydrolase family protein [Tsukamurella sp. 8F]